MEIYRDNEYTYMYTINSRISDVSCNQEAFDKAKPRYEDVLEASVFNHHPN